jgi:hypothetical protein
MLALALLAQIAAAATQTPALAPTRTKTVGTASGSISAGPRTLADVARERKLGIKGVEGGTLSIAGTSGSPASVAPGEPQPPGASSSPSNARVRAAEADVRAARRALDDAAVNKGMTSEDTAAKRTRLAQAQKDLADARDAAARSAR